jgi:hypothetical protein
MSFFDSLKALNSLTNVKTIGVSTMKRQYLINIFILLPLLLFVRQPKTYKTDRGENI